MVKGTTVKVIKDGKVTYPQGEPEAEETGTTGEPSLDWTRGDLYHHAQDLGLDVEWAMTKQELLDAINAAEA